MSGTPPVPNAGYADQKRKRTIVLFVGIVCLTIAVILFAIALIDFVDAMDFDDFSAEPDKFWMGLVAMPFFFVGAFSLQLALVGKLSRFVAGETVPILKDSAANLTDGEGLLGVGRTVDNAATATASDSETAHSGAAGPYCRECGTRNDHTARFCDSCGRALA